MLALCISALVFYFPANFLPVLKFTFRQHLHHHGFQGAFAVFDQGYWVVGLAVLCRRCDWSRLITVVDTDADFDCEMGTESSFWRNSLKQLLKFHGVLSQLTMLEIYAISFWFHRSSF